MSNFEGEIKEMEEQVLLQEINLKKELKIYVSKSWRNSSEEDLEKIRFKAIIDAVNLGFFKLDDEEALLSDLKVEWNTIGSLECPEDYDEFIIFGKWTKLVQKQK